jgi:GTP-binding protein
MVIKDATFLTSVASEKNFLKSDKPIIAVAGKSNVGKSTFINMLANKNKLAKTSNTPGRTRLVNYFDFGEFILADLPGYGFAQVSKSEKEKWGYLMESYFANTTPAHVFSLIDIRHDPTADDYQMVSYLYHFAVPFTLVATKSDKLGKSKVKPQAKYLSEKLKVGDANIIPVSSLEKKGRDEVLAKIESVIKTFYELKEMADEEELLDETEE